MNRKTVPMDAIEARADIVAARCNISREEAVDALIMAHEDLGIEIRYWIRSVSMAAIKARAEHVGRVCCMPTNLAAYKLAKAHEKLRIEVRYWFQLDFFFFPPAKSSTPG